MASHERGKHSAVIDVLASAASLGSGTLTTLGTGAETRLGGGALAQSLRSGGGEALATC